MPLRQTLCCCFVIVFSHVGMLDTNGEALKLFILAGQSNMVGSINVQLSSFPDDQQTVLDDILFTQNIDNYIEPLGPVQPRQVSNGSRRWAGIELTFGETLLDAGMQNIAIVKYARNGSSLAVDWEPDGNLRNNFYNFVDEAIDEITQLGHTLDLEGFIWVQGSGDAHNLERSQDYASNLAQFIGEIEGRYGDTTTILNRYHADANRTYKEVLRQSQRDLADSDSDLYVVHIDDLALNSDFIHFADATELEVGRRLADKYLQTLEPRGDFNRDGVIDARDYATWRNALGSLAELESDGDGDGVVDQDDYAVWRTGFNFSPPPSSQTVPEPHSALLLILLSVLAPLVRRKR